MMGADASERDANQREQAVIREARSEPPPSAPAAVGAREVNEARAQAKEGAGEEGGKEKEGSMTFSSTSPALLRAVMRKKERRRLL
jgi:hypothetical protein